MGRMTIMAVLAFLLLFTGLILQAGTIAGLSLPFFAYVATGFLYQPGTPTFSVDRSLDHRRVARGQPCEVTVTVHNDGNRAEQVLVRDEVPPGLEVVEGNPRMMFSLDGGESRSFSYVVRADRGLYRFSTVSIWVYDALGVVERSARIGAGAELTSLPEPEAVGKIPIRPQKTMLYTGPILAGIPGGGTEFFDVREYRLGDPFRHINWRTFAKYPGKLFTNEFEQERITEVGLIVDGRVRTNPVAANTSLYEYSVRAASALALSFIDDGHRVGLLIYGGGLNWTFPGYGKRQKEKVLNALAESQEGDSQVFQHLDNLPTRLLPARSQVVLITPLAEEDLPYVRRMKAHGYSLLVVSPDPVRYVAAEEHGTVGELALRIARAERELLLRDLEQMGVLTIDWDVSEPLAHTLRRYGPKMQIWNRRRSMG